MRADSVELAAQKVIQGQAADKTEHDAKSGELGSASQHHAEDVARLRAECEANTKAATC